MSAANIPPDESSSLSNPPTEMMSGNSIRSRRSNYLGVLAPLVGALVVLTMATLSFNNPDQVSEWAVDTFLPRGGWFDKMMHSSRRLGRRLYHPQEPAKYFACTNMMSTSDENYDNSLTIDEYKGFTNLYANHHHSQTVGSNLPAELRKVFNKFAKETEGSSNKIIDIYGSRTGERDGISQQQLELLEDLCNESAKTVDELFEEEEETIGGAGSTTTGGDSDAEVKSEPLPPPPPHHSTLAVNASFTMTIPGDMTVEELNDSLKKGEDPGHLKHAFQNFVEHVVHDIGGEVVQVEGEEDLDLDDLGGNATAGNGTLGNAGNATRRTMESRDGDVFGGIRGTGLISFDAGDEEEDEMMEEVRPAQRKRRRRLNVQLEQNSAEIYKYVESPCPGQEAATILDDLNPFGADNSTDDNSTSTSADDERRELTDDEEKMCVTALGKYKIDVDEDEEEAEGGLNNIYQHVQQVTKSAIDNGEMEKELEKEPDGAMFHVEGHGEAEDDDFDPYEEVVVVEDTKKGLRTVDIVLISVGSALIFCLCCVLCFVELERKTRPRQNGRG